MVGRESRHIKKSKNKGIKLLETMAKKTQFEVEFPTNHTSSSEGMITYDSDYHLTCD